MSSGLAAVDQAQFALNNAGVAIPAATKDVAAAHKAAQDFEAVFINEMMGNMFEGISADGPFGGGPGETMFRSLLLDQYSRAIAGQGGFGLAPIVQREILSMQGAPK